MCEGYNAFHIRDGFEFFRYNARGLTNDKCYLVHEVACSCDCNDSTQLHVASRLSHRFCWCGGA